MYIKEDILEIIIRKEKNNENDIKIQGYKENNINEIFDINSFFNSNSKGENLLKTHFPF
tara:strand:- start:267 stop:443 length:177 start_codon:yes stop_codon:yes gene_type:complete